jgi:hypothetical protein
MLPDYTGAMAIGEERLASAARVNRNRPTNPGKHSFVERMDTQLEARFHELAERRRDRPERHWHWPHPLTH